MNLCAWLCEYPTVLPQIQYSPLCSEQSAVWLDSREARWIFIMSLVPTTNKTKQKIKQNRK